MWLYLPVCVRLDELERVSGICIVNVTDSIVSDCFCLSICHLPLPLPQVYVAAPQLYDDIVWHDASVSCAIPILLPHDTLNKYLSDAIANGFDFFPLHNSPSSKLLSIYVVQLQCDKLYTPETASHFLPLKLAAISKPAPIQVSSTPFSLTMPVAFANFLSCGHINYVMRGSEISGYLSDIKYLENMAGGIATSSTGSVGLVLGNLRKKNGDGDLLVICLWHHLWQRLNSAPNKTTLPPLDALYPNAEPLPFMSSNSEKLLTQASMMASAPLLQPTVTPLPFKTYDSVLLVTISLESGTTWGSCVLINDSIIVTNRHVIEPWTGSETSTCSIFARNCLIILQLKDEVVVPYNNLDLAFINLTPKNRHLLSHLQPATPRQNSVCKGEIVKALGYGLIMNKSKMEPFTTEGHVSATVSAHPFSDERKIQCMLIASASCWNGSSGGGLFDIEGNLAGILCSNAQVWVPPITDERKTEKIPLFALCIPMELVSACIKSASMKWRTQNNPSLILPEVENIWLLKSAHRDMFQRNLKL